MADKYTVVEDGEGASCGSMSFWTTQGETARESFTVALEARGLARFTPPRIGVKEALQRAMSKAFKRAAVMIRPLDRTRYTVQLETKIPGQRRIEYRQLMVAEIGVDGFPTIVEMAENEAASLGAAQAILRDEYAHARAHLTSGDIAEWLTKMVKALDAQKLRTGLHFIPKSSVPIMVQVQEILQSFGHDVSRFPIMKTADVARTVLAAYKEEAMQAIAEMKAELEDGTEISERGRRGKLEVLQGIKAKHDKLIQIFQTPLTDVLGELQSLRNQVAGVAFIAQAAEGGQDISEGARILDSDERQVDPTAIIDDEDRADARFRQLEA